VLFQMQLFGLAGAFLTGGLFKLFVLFEVLLLASYGLLLHGGGPDRVRAGLHYVVLNLLGSTVFLFAAGVLYGTLGTLNLADLAVRAATVPPEDLGLVRAGGLLLLAVFALKAALVPVYLWLPAAYANTAPAVAALFAIMTKVGAYAILRTHNLVFGDGAVAGLFDPWLLPVALVTTVLGALGALAAPRLGLLAAYLVVVSVGTLVAAFALGTEGIAAGLYYLPHSTFAGAVLFLLAAAVARRRPSGADRLVGDRDLPRAGLWGGLFLAGGILVVGLPPSSGFLGKFLVLKAAVDAPGVAWVWGVVLGSALLGLVAFVRAGSRVFLKTDGPAEGAPVPAAVDLTAILGLMGLTLALVVAAGPAVGFAQAMAAQLATPAGYIEAVLTAPGVAP
jgi:multicomponent K+:H+ antiporter subunit D